MADIQDDWRPRNVAIPGSGGGTAFIHPCSRCGDPNAAFGFGVKLRAGIPGVWFCAEHRAERIAEEMKAPAMKPEPPKRVVAPVLSSPKQGDLF